MKIIQINNVNGSEKNGGKTPKTQEKNQTFVTM